MTTYIPVDLHCGGRDGTGLVEVNGLSLEPIAHHVWIEGRAGVFALTYVWRIQRIQMWRNDKTYNVI